MSKYLSILILFAISISFLPLTLLQEAPSENGEESFAPEDGNVTFNESDVVFEDEDGDPLQNYNFTNVVLYDDSNYTLIEKNEAVYVLFYSPYCYHCHQFLPTYIETADYCKENKINIVFSRIDANANGNASEAYGIDSYPTVFFIYNGKRFKYEGPRTKDSLLNFANRKKNGDIYKLKFTIDKSYDVNKLNAKQITVIVWDTSANYVKFTTDRHWYYLKRNGDNPYLTPLIIEFIDIDPQDMIVRDNVEGKTLVKVTNPNIDLREITPTIKLGDGSIGYLDASTFTYDQTTGVILFYVTHINKTGNVIVDAWINVDNTEIQQVIRDETFAEGVLGPFIYADDGRLYKFATYSPKFLSDEHYADFVKFTQDVLNTCHTSLDTGNRIGVLEKIARIGNFNDLDKIESPLIDYVHEEYNFEVTPNFDEYLYYMYYKPEDEK